MVSCEAKLCAPWWRGDLGPIATIFSFPFPPAPLARGVLKREKKKWLAAVGSGWWLVIGGWWRLAVVGGWWLVAAGGWRRLVVGGCWRLAVGGGWWLAVGGPLGRSLRAVLNKKKILVSKGPSCPLLGPNCVDVGAPVA